MAVILKGGWTPNPLALNFCSQFRCQVFRAVWKKCRRLVKRDVRCFLTRRRLAFRDLHR